MPALFRLTARPRGLISGSIRSKFSGNAELFKGKAVAGGYGLYKTRLSLASSGNSRDEDCILASLRFLD